MHNESADVCWECGGVVAPVARPGRTGQYRRVSGLKIPADLAIPTCQSCGTEWLDDGLIKVLEPILAAQYAERVRSAVTATAPGKSVLSLAAAMVGAAVRAVLSAQDHGAPVVTPRTKGRPPTEGRNNVSGADLRLTDAVA